MSDPNIEEIRKRAEALVNNGSGVSAVAAWYTIDVPYLLAEIERLEKMVIDHIEDCPLGDEIMRLDAHIEALILAGDGLAKRTRIALCEAEDLVRRRYGHDTPRERALVNTYRSALAAWEKAKSHGAVRRRNQIEANGT